jgi:hypothetical protein
MSKLASHIECMEDKAREPRGASIERWENEGGAPKSGDRSRKKLARDTNERAKVVKSEQARRPRP